MVGEEEVRGPEAGYPKSKNVRRAQPDPSQTRDFGLNLAALPRRVLASSSCIPSSQLLHLHLHSFTSDKSEPPVPESCTTLRYPSDLSTHHRHAY